MHKLRVLVLVRYDRIWELCKETGKKRSYLSVALGHSERYLLDARKQNTNIKPDELKILASELNTTVSYLTGETDEKDVKKQAAQIGELNPDYMRLNEANRAAIDAAIAALLKAQLATDEKNEFI